MCVYVCVCMLVDVACELSLRNSAVCGEPQKGSR